MKNIGWGIVLAITLFQAASFADPPPPPCSQGYKSDSAGRGILTGFIGQDFRPRIGDETCYQAGVQEGAATLRRHNASSSCIAEFQAGFGEGMAVTHRLGSDCFLKGYWAGSATLHMGARERDTAAVGQSCVDAYVRGVLDGKAQRAGTFQNNQRDNDCYLTGYSDSGMYR